MTQVLITGANGMLGGHLAKRFGELKGFNPIPTNRQTFDISNPLMVVEFLEGNKIDYIINCAGVKPERDDFDAMVKTNAVGSRVLAEAVERIPRIKKLVHISTDAVSSENGADSPVSVYGLTKLLGEKNIQNALSDKRRFLICRPAWMYGKSPINSTFVHKFLKAYFNTIASGGTPKLVDDSFGRPVDCEYLFLFLSKMMLDEECHGICDVCHEMPQISRLDFGRGIAKVWNEIHPEKPIDIDGIARCSVDDFPAKYRSPKTTVDRIDELTKHVSEVRQTIPHHDDWLFYLKKFMKSEFS